MSRIRRRKNINKAKIRNLIIVLIIAAIVSGAVGIAEGEGVTDTIIILIVVILGLVTTFAVVKFTGNKENNDNDMLIKQNLFAINRSLIMNNHFLETGMNTNNTLREF